MLNNSGVSVVRYIVTSVMDVIHISEPVCIFHVLFLQQLNLVKGLTHSAMYLLIIDDNLRILFTYSHYDLVHLLSEFE